MVNLEIKRPAHIVPSYSLTGDLLAPDTAALIAETGLPSLAKPFDFESLARIVRTVGAGNSAGQAALHLAKWADRVTVLARGGSLADSMSDYLIRQIEATPNVHVCYRLQVADATGTSHLESLILQDTVSGARHGVPADALFVLIGSQPRTQWLGENVARDRYGFILTGLDLPAGTDHHRPHGRPPLPLETSLPGLFAVGDVRMGSVKRVAAAVGEGAATIPAVHRHLQVTATAPAAMVR